MRGKRIAFCACTLLCLGILLTVKGHQRGVVNGNGYIVNGCTFFLSIILLIIITYLVFLMKSELKLIDLVAVSVKYIVTYCITQPYSQSEEMMLLILLEKSH